MITVLKKQQLYQQWQQTWVTLSHKTTKLYTDINLYITQVEHLCKSKKKIHANEFTLIIQSHHTFPGQWPITEASISAHESLFGYCGYCSNPLCIAGTSHLPVREGTGMEHFHFEINALGSFPCLCFFVFWFFYNLFFANLLYGFHCYYNFVINELGSFTRLCCSIFLKSVYNLFWQIYFMAFIVIIIL